jgi:hypothetical protein
VSGVRWAPFDLEATPSFFTRYELSRLTGNDALRARMHSQPQPDGEIIEGEVIAVEAISRELTRR